MYSKTIVFEGGLDVAQRIDFLATFNKRCFSRSLMLMCCTIRSIATRFSLPRGIMTSQYFLVCI
jgi:hypothetical protein